MSSQKIIDSELEHIPRGSWHSQNKLRMFYQCERKKSLSKRTTLTHSPLAHLMGSMPAAPSRGEILRKCIAIIQETEGMTDFQYDKAFFGETATQN